MDQQLRLGDSYLPKNSESDTTENHLTQNGEDATVPDYELHPEMSSEFSDAATLEQRRAYKIELQVEYCFIWRGNILCDSDPPFLTFTSRVCACSQTTFLGVHL